MSYIQRNIFGIPILDMSVWLHRGTWIIGGFAELFSQVRRCSLFSM